MAEWNPWRAMDELRREIDRAFGNTGLRREPFSRTAFLPGRAARHYPLMNLYEEGDLLYVEALAPGLDPDSIEMSVLGNTLTMAGEKRRLPGDIKPEAFHRSERSTGRFVRSIELPYDVEVDDVKADYKYGLLVVTLPKAAQARAKPISVQIA